MYLPTVSLAMAKATTLECAGTDQRIVPNNTAGQGTSRDARLSCWETLSKAPNHLLSLQLGRSWCERLGILMRNSWLSMSLQHLKGTGEYIAWVTLETWGISWVLSIVRWRTAGLGLLGECRTHPWEADTEAG